MNDKKMILLEIGIIVGLIIGMMWVVLSPAVNAVASFDQIEQSYIDQIDFTTDK